ncbi:MAG: DUF2219 family protein [Pseudomonadales bacterium]
MNNSTPRLKAIAGLALCTACAMAQPGWAESPARVALSIDNDMFAPGGLDRDYTGGARMAATTAADPGMLRPGERLLSWIDHVGALDRWSRDNEAQSVDKTFSFGLLAFAPDNLAATDPIEGERPYANLLYAAHSRFTPSPDGHSALQSTLTVGLLGAPVAEWAHQSIHRTTGATVPRGYSNQLSDGGEVTARYAAALHRFLLVRNGELDRDVRVRIDGSAGFITGIGSSVTARIGRFNAGGWSLRSEQADYLSQAYVAPPLRGGDWIAWASVGIQAQLHNAFLHGQFRNRGTALSRSQTRTAIAEWGVGLSWSIGRATTVDYALRGRSREVTTATGGRSMRWGSITITHYPSR